MNIQFLTSVRSKILALITVLFYSSLLIAQCPDPGTCNTDCTLGNIEIWNQDNCTCENIVIEDPIQVFDSVFNLSDINGSNGFTVNQASFGNILEARTSVSNIGDINADGIDDVVIGVVSSPNYTTTVGEAFVIFGSSNLSNASFNLATLNGTNGFKITATNDAGLSVSNAGDVNGDGIDDLIISVASGIILGSNFATETYVVFGKATPFNAIFNLNTINGTNGFEIIGDGNLSSGYVVSNAGDINADGIDDILIGAPDYNYTYAGGEAYIIFGSNSSFGATFNILNLNGSNGFKIISNNANPDFGTSVSNIGDFNGDGIDDIIIASPSVSYVPNLEADSYVIFGKSTPFSSTLNISSLNGTNGFAIELNVFDFEVEFLNVSNAGDLNADGFDDIIIGVPGAGSFTGDPYAGNVHVLFGQSTPFNPTFDINTLNGSNGFTIYGNAFEGSLGIDVDNAGDVNNDGIDDIILAEFGVQRDYRVIFGSTSAINPNNLDGTNGFILRGFDSPQLFLNSVSNAGDLNGDGIDDLIVVSNDFGETAIVYGRSQLFEGCTDSLAANYNPNATCDDGSCIFSFLGCTDSLACNYNPLANADDGSCLLNYGCTNAQATNYNPSANCDDSSCTYDCSNLICQDGLLALNNNGNANLSAVNLILNNSCYTSINASPNTFNCGNLGENNVTISAVDSLGNISTCQSTVTVIDEEAPVCSTQDISVNLDQFGNAQIVAQDINLESYDGCSIYIDGVFPCRFGCDEAGITVPVVLSISDYFQNISTCFANVTVLDPMGVCTGNLCGDGIQNGDELGVDCGGDFCAPCGE